MVNSSGEDVDNCFTRTLRRANIDPDCVKMISVAAAQRKN
jgi:hypothetical protein